MRKQAASILAGLGLVACLALPGQAGAVTYEDGLEDCSYPKMADLFLVRPIGLNALVFGSVIFVGFSPWIALAAPGDFGSTANTLVKRPAWFTFSRPLGECSPSSTL